MTSKLFIFHCFLNILLTSKLFFVLGHQVGVQLQVERQETAEDDLVNKKNINKKNYGMYFYYILFSTTKINININK